MITLFLFQEIARSTTKHFLILFRDHGCQYRGLYSFDPDAEEAYKIIGVGPRQLGSSMVERFYKSVAIFTPPHIHTLSAE